MKKILLSLAIVAMTGIAVACSSGTENNTQEGAAEAATEQTAEQAEADTEETPAVDPLKRDFETADYTLTIPEGWTGEIDPFDSVVMKGKADNGFDPKIEVSILTDETVKSMLERYDDGKWPNSGTKVVGDYTFSTLSDDRTGLNWAFAQVGDNVLRVKSIFIKIDAPETVAVLSSLKLK